MNKLFDDFDHVQWEKDHSVEILASESGWGRDVAVTVQGDPHNGQVRMDVGIINVLPPKDRRGVAALMTPDQTRRLIDLLLAAVTESEGVSATK
jgi:hypothetical protein